VDSRYYLDSGYKNPNSIRKFRIYKVFFNNLFFQLSNRTAEYVRAPSNGKIKFNEDLVQSSEKVLELKKRVC